MNVSAKLSKVWNGKAVEHDTVQELRRALFNSAGQIVARARAKVPRASGALYRSIRRKRGSDTKEPVAYVFAGDRAGGVYWHGFVEYGTKKMAARPFLRPAGDAARSSIISGAKRAVRKTINKPRPGAK